MRTQEELNKDLYRAINGNFWRSEYEVLKLLREGADPNAIIKFEHLDVNLMELAAKKWRTPFVLKYMLEAGGDPKVKCGWKNDEELRDAVKRVNGTEYNEFANCKGVAEGKRRLLEIIDLYEQHCLCRDGTYTSTRQEIKEAFFYGIKKEEAVAVVEPKIIEEKGEIKMENTIIVKFEEELVAEFIDFARRPEYADGCFYAYLSGDFGTFEIGQAYKKVRDKVKYSKNGEKMYLVASFLSDELENEDDDDDLAGWIKASYNFGDIA